MQLRDFLAERVPLTCLYTVRSDKPIFCAAFATLAPPVSAKVSVSCLFLLTFPAIVPLPLAGRIGVGMARQDSRIVEITPSQG
jgi:hypothetical protein